MIPTQMNRSIRGLAGAACLSSALVANAQVVFTSMSSQLIDFDTTVANVNNGAFAGAGFQSSPTAGQLDSDAWAATGWSNGSLAFGGTQTTASTDYTRGAAAASVVTGGFYGFDVDTGAAVNRALGIQPGGSDWAPGTLTLRLQNQTGTTINQLSINYTIYVRPDQGRANSFNFSHSADDSSYTAEATLDYTSPAAATVSVFVTETRSITLTGLSVADNDFYYLRWSGADVSGSGSRDEFALDDIEITAIGAPVPEPSTYAGIAGGLLLGFGAWRRSTRKG